MIVAKLSAGLQPKEWTPLLYGEYKMLGMLMNDFHWIARVPIISILVLIVCLIRIASMSLTVLFKEISFRESASSSEKNQLITKWRKNYILVRDLVAEMNAFFGRPVIIVVILAMISSINLTFVLIIKIIMNDFSYIFDYITEILTNIICLSLLAFISEQIPQQVS